jgi:hypothetical protein
LPRTTKDCECDRVALHRWFFEVLGMTFFKVQWLQYSLGFEPFAVTSPTELRANWSEGDVQSLINVAYRQVFGNEHFLYRFFGISRTLW